MLFSVDLKGATGLPLMVSHAFVQYELGGQLFTTETIEQDTHNPLLEYSFIHHVERVSSEVRVVRVRGVVAVATACVCHDTNVSSFEKTKSRGLQKLHVSL